MNLKYKNKAHIFEIEKHTLSDGTTMPLMTYPMISDTGFVKHVFTTRQGGVSKGIYESLNLSFTRGDDAEAVKENFARLAQAMDINDENFVFTDQTHTTNVIEVDESYAGCGLTKPRTYTDVDGMITNTPGIVLSTFYADCVPLYFVDPVHQAIGLSHSGWRGTVGRMGAVTLEKMHEAYGTNPAETICAIGPSICQDCYEISEDVAVRFIEEFQKQKDEILINKGNGKYQLDLWRANEIVLMEAGIKKEHIATTNVCTCCNHELLFSHRASHGKRGNLGAFLSII